MENTIQKTKFKRLEISGFIVVSICAVLFHFLYEFSGDNFFVGLFAAVNESVWEHTKILYFPYLAFAVVEYFVLKPPFKRFFICKTIGLAFLSIVTISFFYTYTGIIGEEFLALDIVCTFIWAAVAHVISYRLFYSNRKLERYVILFALLFIVQLLMELLFTPLVPHIPLFMDPETGVFGFG